MSISSVVVQWLEEWQLRVLVLTSLAFQLLLFIFAIRRKHVISQRIRFCAWVTYVGSDAITISALAVLFDRERNNISILELVWVPVLLTHLGGQDCITAYNIEDNELWREHTFTAVSKIMGAIYVFCQSWPTTGGDKRLLYVSIFLFIPGILKCLEKPWALKSASINSLVSSSDVPAARSGNDDISTLERYVQKAKQITNPDGQDQPPQAAVQAENRPDPSVMFKIFYHPSKLFVDLASPYADRVDTLQSFWKFDKREAYASLQLGIHATFDRLYTKIKMTSNILSAGENGQQRQDPSRLQILATCVRFLALILPVIVMGLLQSTDTQSYDENDVNVTYVLLFCTFLEGSSFLMSSIGASSQEIRMEELLGIERSSGRERSYAGMVAQYSLIRFFARNKRHSTKMRILSTFGCKDFVDQLWHMKPCDSSAQIIELVIEHVKKGWKEEIYDAASYRKFNDRRGQWTLGANHHQHLGWSLKRPFDQSVLLWHITTDVCFYTSSPHQDVAWCETSPHYETAIRCREISQYMMYLLFINPEMLLAGTRRNLFTAAYDQLEEIFKGQNQCPNGMEIFELEEMRIITMLKSQQGSLSHVRGGFFHDAMALADTLRSLNDEKKVWEVIQGVWVEMLCFSASRSRGYLHAKSLGAGGEFLTYVWLLLSHMGMETLPERLQGIELEL